MAHRRRNYDEQRRSEEGDDFRGSPGRFDDSSWDREERRELFEEERRSRFDRGDEGRNGRAWKERETGEDDRWEGHFEDHDGERRERRRDRERSRERRYRRSRSAEDRGEFHDRSRENNRDREDFRSRDGSRDDREWRRSPGRDRERRRWRDSSRENNSPRSSTFGDNRDRSRSPHSSNFGDASQLGEWNCRCGALNFKRRFTCYRQYCGASRNDAVSVSPIDKLAHPHPNSHQNPNAHMLPHHRQQPKRLPPNPLNMGLVPPKQAFTAEDIPRMAAYSAQMYASNLQEQATYLKYYTQYYTQQLALTASTESDKVNAAAAVAQSAINQVHARTPVVAPPNGTDNRMYPVPDTSTYLYDETSGFYYDSVTGLYYDPNTQYYFNNQINQYLYWDMSKFTYSLANTAQQVSAAPQAPAAPVLSTATPSEVTPADDKKKDKPDKVKVAKKIAKDMERWAKTQNQKKDIARNNAAPEASKSSTSVSADIGFSVLEQRVPVVSAPPVIAPSPPPTLVPSYGAGSDSSGDESESIIDWNKLACLLCKRQFPSKEVLEKHQVMSDLHKQNLAALKTSRSSKDLSYRDRAAERRMKYGEDEPVMVRNVRPDPVMSSVPQAIGEENIGNRLLQKMGWQAGQGLGKEGQGRVGPVEATTGGLGRKKGIYTAGPGETYKECVKKLTMARYQDLIGSEGLP